MPDTPVSDHARFEAGFGAALAGVDSPWHADPRVARALTIHRNTSHKAAQDALAANYPVTAQLVGAEAFAAAAAAFVVHAPPAEPRLCLFGAGLADFLPEYAPFAALGWLPDVARLERAVVEALFAADDDVFDGAALDPDRPLVLHAATRLVRLAAPAATIWHTHQPGGDPETLESLDWQPEIALVTRPGGNVMVTPIDAVAAKFVDDCNAGRTLGEAAVSAADAGGETGGDLATLFAVLIGAGAFKAIGD